MSAVSTSIVRIILVDSLAPATWVRLADGTVIIEKTHYLKALPTKE